MDCDLIGLPTPRFADTNENFPNTLPLLLMHGDADQLVPVANARRWSQAWKCPARTTTALRADASGALVLTSR